MIERYSEHQKLKNVLFIIFAKTEWLQRFTYLCVQNMPEYRSSLIRILQYKKRIVNSVLIRKDMGLRKPEIWHFYAIDMI